MLSAKMLPNDKPSVILCQIIPEGPFRATHVAFSPLKPRSSDAAH